MGYSSSAINAAMSKSLLFNNITNGEALSGSNYLKIGNFEKNGYYKISLMADGLFISFDFSNGTLISSQTLYPSFTTKIDNDASLNKEFTLANIYLNTDIENNNFSIPYIKFSNSNTNIFDPSEIKNLNCNIEFLNGNFNYKSDFVDNIGAVEKSLECKANETTFGIAVSTESIALTNLEVTQTTSELLFVREMVLGNWKISGDPSNGKLLLSLTDEDPETGGTNVS